MPKDEGGFRARMKVKAACWNFARMKFGSNPKLATITMSLFAGDGGYLDWLCGEDCLAYTHKGENDMPLASPTLSHVLRYDFVIRKDVMKRVNKGQDFKTALEAAMADTNLRSLYFAAQFACDVAQGHCKELSAPGLAEMYLQLMGHIAKKRKLEGAAPGGKAQATATSAISAGAKKRAKKQAAKNKTAAAQADKHEHDRRGAQSGRDRAATGSGGGGGRGHGGGGGGGGRGRGSGGGAAPKGGGKGGLPDGAVRVNPNTNRQICFVYCKGNGCSRTPCNFEHVCWFCFKNHPGKDCSQAQGAAGAPGR